jgi:hypothetical protein
MNDQQRKTRAGRLAHSTSLLIKELRLAEDNEKRAAIWRKIDDNALDGCLVALMFTINSPQ